MRYMCQITRGQIRTIIPALENQLIVSQIQMLFLNSIGHYLHSVSKFFLMWFTKHLLLVSE